MRVAVVTTARAATVGASGAFCSSLERWWPAARPHVLLSGSVERGPEGATSWTIAQADDTPYPTTMILPEVDQLALVLPGLIRRLLADHDACLLLRSGQLVVASPDHLLEASRAATTLIVPALTTSNESSTPLATRASSVGKPLTRAALWVTGESVNLLADWSQAVAEAVIRLDRPSVAAVARSHIRTMMGRADVTVEGEHTMLRWPDYAAVEAGLAQGPRASIVDCHRMLRSFDADASDETGAATDLARHRLHDPRPLAPLLDTLWAYRDRRGQERRPSPYERFRTEVWRVIDPYGRRWGEGDSAGFDAWLAARNSAGCTRAAHLVVLSRTRLRKRFQEVRFDPHGFRAWLREGGRRKLGFDPLEPGESRRPTVDARVGAAPNRAVRGRKRPGRTARHRVAARLRSIITRSAKRSRRRAPRPLAVPRYTAPTRSIPTWASTGREVNLLGPLRTESGLGQASRASLAALRDLGIPISHVDLSEAFPSRSSADAGLGAEMLGQTGDIDLLHCNPADMLSWADTYLRHRLGGRFTAGIWFWEPANLPARLLQAFDLVDEVWVASSYLRDVFGQYGRVPVHVIGTALDLPERRPGDRARFGLDFDDLVFSFVYDAYSGYGRKNPLEAMEAFVAAFGPGFDGVRFVLKVSNLDKYPDHRRAVLGLAARYPAIAVIDHYLEGEGVLDLIAASDVYVSLHAAEGLGLTLLEAMAMGTPTICTGFSGNMDFTNDTNSWLVGYELARLGTKSRPYPASSIWAAPRVDEAVDLMRHVAANRDEIAAKGALAERDAREASSPARYRARLGSEIDRVR